MEGIIAYRFRKTNTKVDGQAATKYVAVPRVEDEDDAERNRRLKAQAAKNRMRMKSLGGDRYSVTSQRRTEDGERGEAHEINAENGRWVCSCQWGEVHPGNECAGVAQVRAYRKDHKLPEFPELTKAEQKDADIDAKMEAKRLQRQANRARYNYSEEL